MDKLKEAPTQSSYKFEPKKGWSELRVGASTRRVYEGPVNRVRYPASCDGFQEMIVWTGLGYHLAPVQGLPCLGTVITVYVHSPEDFQAVLEVHGVTFQHAKGTLELFI